LPPALAAKWPHVFGPADEAEDAEAAEAALCAKLASMNAEEAVLTYYTPEERAAYARIQLQNVQLPAAGPVTWVRARPAALLSTIGSLTCVRPASKAGWFIRDSEAGTSPDAWLLPRRAC